MILKFNKKIILSSLFFSMSLLVACEPKNSTEKPHEEKIINVDTYEIKTSLPSRIIKYYGFVEAIQKVQVVSKVSGEVSQKLISGGEFVKKGELLFQIEKEPYAYSLRSAQYETEKEKLNLDNIQKEYERSEKLKTSKSISASESDLLATKKSISEAQLAVLKARELKAKFDLDSTDVRSPIEGRVSFSRINTGDYSQAGVSQLAELINDKAMYVQFSMPDSDFNKFKRDNTNNLLSAIKAEVFADGFGGIPARLNFGTESFQKQVGAITLRAEFSNEAGQYKDGQFVQVALDVPLMPNSFLVPKKSVFFVKDESFVYVVQDNQTAKRVKVIISEEIDQKFCVQAGLALGDKIVVDNLAQLEDGIKIKQHSSAAQTVAQNDSNLK